MTESTGSPTGETPATGDGDTKPLELPEESPGTPGYTVAPKDDDRGVEGVAEEPAQ